MVSSRYKYQTLLPEEDSKSLIDLEMIPTKATYFLSEMSLSAVLPIYNIFCVSLGLTSAQAGLISGIGYAAASLASPLWTLLIDYTGYKKLIFVIMCSGTIMSVFATPWIAFAVATYRHNNACHANDSIEAFSLQNNCRPAKILTNPTELLNSLILLSILSRIFYCTLPNCIDALAMTVIKTRKKETIFGNQRWYGSLGSGVAVLLAGVIIDHYNPVNISRYTAAFYLFLPCTLLLLPFGYIMTRQIPSETEKDEITTSVGSHLISYLKKPDTIMFLLTTTVSGMAYNVYINFVFLLMDDYMGASKTVTSLNVVMGVLCEIIAYPFASKFIRQLRGPIPVIAIGIFSYLPRFVIMSYISNPWLALPPQLFHIFGLALSWAAQMEYAYETAPKEITITVIGIIANVHYVGSCALANIVGGIVYDQYGGPVLFRYSGIVCFIWFLIMLLYYAIRIYQSNNSGVDMEQETENNLNLD